MTAVDSPSRSTVSWREYYAEMAVYHDTKGDAIIGGWKVWDVSLALSFSSCKPIVSTASPVANSPHYFSNFYEISTSLCPPAVPEEGSSLYVDEKGELMGNLMKLTEEVLREKGDASLGSIKFY